MNNQKTIRDIANAIYDHKFVTINLTNGRSIQGRISNMSSASFGVGINPRHRNRYRIDEVESVKLH